MKHGQLESVRRAQLSGQLDNGLPQIFNLDSYIRIVKDKSILRRIIFASQKLIDRALMGEEEPDEILAGAEETLLKLGEAGPRQALVNPAQIIREFEGGLSVFLDPSKRIKGISTGFREARRDDGGPARRRTDYSGRAAFDGQDGAGAEHGAARGARSAGSRTVAVFSLEMSKESLLTRMVCASARVDQQKFRAGYLNADERRRLQMALMQTGGGAAVHRRYGRREPDGHPRQTAAAAGGARAWAGGGRLSAVDERPRAVRRTGIRKSAQFRAA